MRDSNPRVGCIGTVRLGTCLIRGKSHVGSVHFNRGMKTAVDNPWLSFAGEGLNGAEEYQEL